MVDKLLCFRLNGYPLAVEPEQIEKILINKNPARENFVLETGVEVKSLKSYIPLPEKEDSISSNIMFVKDQKDFYGFTVDRIIGYLRLTGAEKLHPRKHKSPIKYFVRNEGRLIPVLDLQYITNSGHILGVDDLEEIKNVSRGYDEQLGDEDVEEVFQEISEEDIYRTIDDEIKKRKTDQQWDNIIRSEKRGLVLPLIVNISIIAFVSLGFLYYFIMNRVNIREQLIGEKISGVEEELIREIRRRSEAEVEEQRRKLEDARKRLEMLQQEKDFFLQNQDKLLQEREAALNAEFQRKLDEARKRLEASGVSDIDAEIEKERERLYGEYLSSRDDVREQIESVKRQYEQELESRETSIKQELDSYSKRISEVEQRLIEEQAKLKEAEERVQSIEAQQQEYISFRRQLNSTYNEALGYIQRKNYARGIEKLKTLLPVIESARQKGIGEAMELEVEEDLVNSILYLAEREQNRIDLDQIGEKTLEAARALEREGKLKEALSRYYTVYTVSGSESNKNTAITRADAIMDRIYRDRSESERIQLEQEADQLFAKALTYKKSGDFKNALGNLEKIITDISVKTRNRKTLDEIIAVNKLWAQEEEQKEKNMMDQKASVVYRDAERSYKDGYYTEALSGMEAIVLDYRESDYAERALSEIMRINKEMRGVKASPPRSFKGGDTDSGVIIQALAGGNVLFNLGGDSNVKEGDVLQVFRKENDQFSFVGSIRAMEVYPRLTRGKVVYSEEVIKVGDIIAF
jgi:hypothetical protein